MRPRRQIFIPGYQRLFAWLERVFHSALTKVGSSVGATNRDPQIDFRMGLHYIIIAGAQASRGALGM